MENLQNSNTHIDPVAPNQAGLQNRISQQSAQAKKGGPKVWLILLIVILVLGGVGTWWYYAYGQTMLLARQIKWSWGQDFSNFRSDVSIDLTFSNIKENYSGGFFDVPDSTKINIANVQHNVNQDFEGGGDYSVSFGDFGIILGLDYKKIGTTFYVKPNFKSIADPYESDNSQDMINILTDRWIYFTNSDISQVVPILMEDDGNSAQLQEKNEKFLEELKKIKAFTISDARETKNSVSGELKKLNVYIDPNKIEDMVRLSINIYDNNPEKGLARWEEDITEDPESWAKAKDFISNIGVAIWVNSKTKIIQGVDLTMNNLEYMSNGLSATVDGSVSFLIVEEEPISISTPLNAVSVEQLEEEMMQQAEERMMEMYSVDMDEDGLSDFNEDIYGTDPTNSDTDGDGYLDGEEVNNGYNPLGEGTFVDVWNVPEGWSTGTGWSMEPLN